MTDEKRPATDEGAGNPAHGEEGHVHGPDCDHDHEHPHEGEGAAAAEGGEGAEAEAKLRQTVEIKDVGPCKKHIKVTVNREDIDSRFDEKFSELVMAGDNVVAGFRPGKAPRKVVERRFGREVGEQVKAEVLMASLEQLAEENDVAPLSPPDLDPAKIDIPEEGDLVYEFDVEVRPEFELPTYKGLKLKRPVREFSADDVAREERRLLEPHGQIVPKAAPAAAELGDVLVTDIVTTFEGREVNKAQEVQFRVEPRLALKDGVAEKFGEVMAGAKAGDVRTVDIRLTDGVADPAMRGKTVQAAFHVKDVKTIRLPELTPELLKRFGANNPDQLRELIRGALQRRLEYMQRQSAREQVLALINESASWDLPQDLLRRQARRALQRRIMEMRAAGISDQEIEGRQRLLQQDVLRSTALALKEHFVLQKIAEEEKLKVEDEDIDDEIERIAWRNDESPRRVRAKLEKEDMLEALAVELIERKALDLVLESATYDDQPMGAAAATEGDPVATSEAQAVPGEMHEPTDEPPAAAEGEAKADPSA
jgi:trigger factor